MGVFNDIVQGSTAIGALSAAFAALHNGRKIKEVRHEVNNTAKAALKRTEQLSKALSDRGIDVPEREPVEDDPYGH